MKVFAVSLTRLASCCGAVGMLFSGGAQASITYDYTQRYLYDSESGLYWQLQSLPTATFVPTTGSVATSAQLSELATRVGVPTPIGVSGGIQTSSLLLPLANFLSFLEFNAPVRANTTVREFSISALVSNDPYGFEYVSMSYSSPSVGPALWMYASSMTIGSYGPVRSCPSFPNCPDSAPAFIVSSIAPVPLPPSIWLLITGLIGLSLPGNRHNTVHRHSQPNGQSLEHGTAVPVPPNV